MSAKIKLPIDEIRAGECILFLGSGFSRGSKNVLNEDLKSAQQLQEQMLDECKVKDIRGYDLDSSAEKYEEQFGTEAIVDLIHKNFQVKSVTPTQELIVCQPWYRIYTTNYDNIVEACCTNNGKRLSIKSIDSTVEQPNGSTTQLIHIYGDVLRISPNEFKEKFLLTESQRDNSSFIKSRWFQRFNDDILYSKKLIFCGFSASDIDIKRLLGKLPPWTKTRVFFIDHHSAPEPIIKRFKRFGEVDLSGSDGFAASLAKKHMGDPIKNDLRMPNSLREIKFDTKLRSNIRSGDIEFLLTAGIVDTNKMRQTDIDGSAGSYTFQRNPESYRRATTFAGHSRPILVHSDIGNGKTVFINQISLILTSKEYRVFKVVREPERADTIVTYIDSLDEKSVLIFDDVMNYKSIISDISSLGKNNINIISSVRSTVLRTARPAICNRLGSENFTEIDLNQLNMRETRSVIQYLSENSLLGNYAELSDQHKERFIQITCGGQVRDVILKLFESGVLHQKVETLLASTLDLSPPMRRLIVLGAIMTLGAGREYSQLAFASEIVDYDGTFSDISENLEKHELGGLLQFDSNEISFRSPALAEFMLRNNSSVEEILDVCLMCLKNLSALYGDDTYFDPLNRALLKFSLIGKFIRSKNDETIIDDFYSDCRTLNIAKRDPLFHVQRSISQMHFGNFDVSKRYVAQAYGMARRINNYDTFQIETHEAKLLLSEALAVGLSPKLTQETKAQNLLESVISRSDNNFYHPLSVMRLYSEITAKHSHSWSVDQMNKMVSLIDRSLSRINAFPQRVSVTHHHLPHVKARLRQTVKLLRKKSIIS